MEKKNLGIELNGYWEDLLQTRLPIKEEKGSKALTLQQFLIWNTWTYKWLLFISCLATEVIFIFRLYCFVSPPSNPNSKGIKVVLVVLLLRLLHFSAQWLSLKYFYSCRFRCCLSSIVPLVQSIFLPVTSVLFILIPIQTFLFLWICLQTPYLTKKLFLGKPWVLYWSRL